MAIRILGITIVVLVALGLGVYSVVTPPAPPASQAFVNATVLTMDEAGSVAEAVVVEGDRIVAVGSRADIEGHIDADTVVHDLGGRVLLPGFIDAHGHFPGSGLSKLATDLTSPPVGRMERMQDVLDALRASVAETASGEWILGFGYDDTLLAEKRHPTREDLDGVSTEHPIYLWHVSGHMGVGNSLALERGGIGDDTPDPEGGVIVRDPATGVATGLLEENAALPVQMQAMDFSALDFAQMIRHAAAEYARVGVTTAQSGAVDGSMGAGLAFAARVGLVPFRLELWPIHEELGDAVLAGESGLEDIGDRVKFGAIKIIADGSIQGYTGYLSEPYHVPFKGDASYRGYPRIPRDELIEIVKRYHAAGLRMAIHGNGDASIDDIIAAFRAAQAATPREDPRLIVIHSQMARDDQLDDMKALGMTPSFFSAHTYYWGDRHAAIFMGPERAARMSPTRSALDRDLRFTVHLDTPVTPMDPLMGVWATVNRMSSGGQVIGAEQRVGPMQALRAVTIDAAWQIFREDELGSIEPGKLADLVVLDGDPRERPEAIRDLRVERTIVGGVTIFDAAESG